MKFFKFCTTLLISIFITQAVNARIEGRFDCKVKKISAYIYDEGNLSYHNSYDGTKEGDLISFKYGFETKKNHFFFNVEELKLVFAFLIELEKGESIYQVGSFDDGLGLILSNLSLDRPSTVWLSSDYIQAYAQHMSIAMRRYFKNDWSVLMNRISTNLTYNDGYTIALNCRHKVDEIAKVVEEAKDQAIFLWMKVD